jgi:hypothetical protein
MKNVTNNNQEIQKQEDQSEKIKRQILFGAQGPWTDSFKTLLNMGIDVQKLLEENLTLKANHTEQQNAVLTCEELIQDEPGAPITKRRLIDYDLSPLKDIIECGGIGVLIETLRTLHNDIVEASLSSFDKGEHGIFENNPDLVEQLFYIKKIADTFDDIRSETYQLKSYPVEELQEVG